MTYNLSTRKRRSPKANATRVLSTNPDTVRMRALYAERIVGGLCGLCGREPSPGGALCPICLAKHAAYYARNRARRIAQQVAQKREYQAEYTADRRERYAEPDMPTRGLCLAAAKKYYAANIEAFSKRNAASYARRAAAKLAQLPA